MPQTLLQIANSALIKIGAPFLDSLSDEGKHATVINARLIPVRDMLLRSHVWRFTATFAELDRVEPEFANWTDAFTLPDDFLRLMALRTEPDGTRVTEYEIATQAEGQVILVESTTLFIKYVRSPADGFLYPDDFAEAFAAYLAAEITTSMFDNAANRQQWLAQYEGLIRQARFNGAVEQPLNRIEASEWLDARNDIAAPRINSSDLAEEAM